MVNEGIIRGSHHLTFCVGGAQEDYDFHVGVLGLRLVKKSVLLSNYQIYHLFYGNRLGDGSTVLTAFPFRQAGRMGKRGTNQLKTMSLAVPADSIAFWADRLKAHGIAYEEAELFGTQRLDFQHPCGIHYALVGETESDDREPWDGGDVSGEHAIRGVYGTTTSLRDPEPMDFFITEGMSGVKVASDGPHHQYRVGTDEGYGRMLEFVEEPDLPQGTWHLAEGTIHHHAFDVISAENQALVKDRLVGLGFVDVSHVFDRFYFYSVYCRSPSGALFEFAHSHPQGYLVDEPEDELGTNICLPPWWEDRRDEINLEPIVARERVG